MKNQLFFLFSSFQRLVFLGLLWGVHFFASMLNASPAYLKDEESIVSLRQMSLASADGFETIDNFDLYKGDARLVVPFLPLQKAEKLGTKTATPQALKVLQDRDTWAQTKSQEGGEMGALKRATGFFIPIAKSYCVLREPEENPTEEKIWLTIQDVAKKCLKSLPQRDTDSELSEEYQEILKELRANQYVPIF